MTLKVIGSGFGRTGTKSLKDAIEFLGIGRCYHMAEVFGLPNAPRQWIDAAEGRPDWPAIYEGFSATVEDRHEPGGLDVRAVLAFELLGGVAVGLQEDVGLTRQGGSEVVTDRVEHEAQAHGSSPPGRACRGCATPG